MISILIASHGRLGEEMIRTAEYIYGEIAQALSKSPFGEYEIRRQNALAKIILRKS